MQDTDLSQRTKATKAYQAWHMLVYPNSPLLEPDEWPAWWRAWQEGIDLVVQTMVAMAPEALTRMMDAIRADTEPEAPHAPANETG